MEIILNRIKYKCEFDDVKIIVSSDPNELTFTYNLGAFKDICGAPGSLLNWIKENKLKSDVIISFEFSRSAESKFLSLPLVSSLNWKYTWFLIGQSLLSQGLLVDYRPIGVSISAFRKKGDYNDEWDIFERIDFDLNYNDYKGYGEATFNIGSQSTLISKGEIKLKDDFGNVKVVDEKGRVLKSKYTDLSKGRVIANKKILDHRKISSEKKSISYSKRYKELLEVFNLYLKSQTVEGFSFFSTGFESVSAQMVSFQRNKMVFKNENTDINPVSGMRNYGVYKTAPRAIETKFIFIFQHNDDANTLFKYLKNGFKGFPGLERYVDIPVVLADAVVEGKQFKQLKYGSLETIMQEYQEFEAQELPDNYYENYFAIVIGAFDRDLPEQVYYDLKLALLSKGIPSQFVNHQNIRKSSIFNYHLPNIAIGIHAKLGGIPWRIDSKKKRELIVGFNQDFNKDRERFLAGSVFFDNQGNLRRTFSFPESSSSTEIIGELKSAVNLFLEENDDVNRIVIHYHKSLSKREKKSIDKLLREDFEISVPYAVVEINDTKSKLEIGFDPEHNFQMPVSGTIVRISKRDYLLFNNNRFKALAPVRVKDELPLKIKIHFADESGFSHKELIEQVYEFSRLIWKGLKQRSQPATCFYAREIARFKAHANHPIPENRITQTTPWVL
jgi:hypothetical protein